MSTFPGIQGDVYYRKWLVDDPVASYVFLHGFGEHSGLYQRFAVALNDARIDLWALDQIGHGHTGGERGLVESIDHLVENGRRLTEIVRTDLPAIPIVLAGHSLGGVTAALTVARDPEPFAGAVLSGTPLSALPWVTELAGANQAELSLDAADLSSDPWYLDALQNDPLAFTSAHVARTLGGTLPPAWEELDYTLERIDLPILLVHGGADPIAPVADARAWTSRLRQGELAEFEGAKHDVLNESAYAAVAERIIEFVAHVTTAVRS
jgi:alpha-beta hydrolase superfamily lysophospholipase